MNAPRDILDYVKEEIRGLRAYKIEHKRVPVKLDANECNLPLPPKLAEEIAQALARPVLNRYPSGHSDRLREELARRLGVKPPQIVVANGSNEVIQILLTAFSRRLHPERPAALVIPTPTFGMYPVIATYLGMRVVTVPLRPDFSLDANAILEAAGRERASVVILASPNNPTGNCFADDAIEAVLAGFQGLVVVDEAYFPFSRRTFLPRLATSPNLAIVRTLSKVGLAALRIGFTIASERVGEELAKVRLPFGVNVLSETAALVVLSHHAAMLDLADRVRTERDRVAPLLARIDGVHPFPSLANFILLRTEADADRVQADLLARGISVRNFNRGGMLENCLRVTIGTPEENDQFLAELPRVNPGTRSGPSSGEPSMGTKPHP